MTYLRRTFLSFVCALFALPALGQATRTWVSGTGSDANPCSRTSPCQTFAGAISKTAAGGEIDALDPSGYGAVTITKAITIDGGGGQVASILASGQSGINISAGGTDVVTIRNLSINGTPTGQFGINILSAGTVRIEKCVIFGFNTSGVNIAAPGVSVSVLNSQIEDLVNSSATGNGVSVTGSGSTTLLENVQIFHTSVGIAAGDGTTVTARNIDIATANSGVLATGTSSGVLLSLDTAVIVGTTVAVQANGASAAITMNNCTFTNNGTVFGSGGGTIGSYGTNRVKPGNGTVGVITQTFATR